MSNKGLLSLIDVWKIIGDRRREHYNHQGIVYLRRDEDGVVQERYFKTLKDLEKEYSTLSTGAWFDLSDKVE